MTYTLKVLHLKPTIVNDRKTSVLALEEFIKCKTRKAANQYLLDQELVAKNLGRTTRKTIVKRGDGDSELFVFTGNSWREEDSGERRDEYYWMLVEKQS